MQHKIRTRWCLLTLHTLHTPSYQTEFISVQSEKSASVQMIDYSLVKFQENIDPNKKVNAITLPPLTEKKNTANPALPFPKNGDE